MPVRKTEEAYLILHDIRSAYNVGAIFRTADAVGISKIYMTGYTPSPLDRFNRPRKDISKAALGAEMFVPWEHVKNIAELFKKLKKEKVFIIGLEQDKRAIDYKKERPRRKTALVLGNEVRGMRKKLREACDEIIQIPMRGKKESLNVSVAAGIALFRLFDG